MAFEDDSSFLDISQLFSPVAPTEEPSPPAPADEDEEPLQQDHVAWLFGRMAKALQAELPIETAAESSEVEWNSPAPEDLGISAPEIGADFGGFKGPDFGGS